MKDSISEALGMAPLIPYTPEPSEVQVIDQNPTAEFDEVKKNLRALIKNVTPAMENLIDVAIGAENSKIYDSLANLMKAMVEANRELADTHVKQVSATGPAPTTINNNLNITAADLLKMIRKGAEE